MKVLIVGAGVIGSSFGGSNGRELMTRIMKRSIGLIVLGLSACGFPLTQLVIRRWGVRGAAVAEVVCVGLVIRDTAMVMAGIPRRLRPSVAALLWLELGAGVMAAVTGLGPLLRPGSAGATEPPGALEIARRVAVGTLFGLHTLRFGIYLRPDQGRRRSSELPDDFRVGRAAGQQR